MTGTYPVILGSKSVGAVTVVKQGLYYCFACNCTFPDNGIYTISAQCGRHYENIGICIPDGEHYKLEKKIPVKYFPQKEPCFIASRRSTESDNIFIPLESGGDFQHLSQLMDARFQYLDGKCGVNLHAENCCLTKEGAVHP